MTGGLLGAALRYADRGWPVFPCKPDNPACRELKCRRCKVPAIPAAHPEGDPCRATCRGECGQDGHGCHDATTDEGRIVAWWSRWPGANVAIATGEPGPDVLDVDIKPDGNGFGALNRLKRAGLVTGAAVLIRTRSRCLHIYFAGTGQGCHALPRHHLDFKSAGGYVLAPPSRIHGSPYELLEQRDASGRLSWPAVKRLLDPPPRPRARPSRWEGEELPPGVQRALAADAADRSAALHRLVGACVRAGMDEDAIHQLAASYQPALEKYGARLGAEVERSLSRIGS